MKIKTVTAAVVILLFTAACQQAGPKESVGTLGGAALGGLLGSQFGSGKGQLAATGAGVFLGALIGNQIGRGLDDVDRIKIDQANARAKGAPIGETIAWNNPSTGNSGTVTPVRDGTSASGDYCREFQQTVTVGGSTEQAYGTACRQPDGSWRIVQ
ncbi:MAG: RT0821/Lpp0805 family surface protein [Rhodospirillales bacterium]|nr:RT0821/Lpp0805 family surface protein [Rhodospirillales bacterium]